MNTGLLLKRLFVKNLPYKIIALIITLVLWIFISKEKNLEIGIKAKLIIKTRPGLVVSSDIPNEIKIRVMGPRIFLQPLLLREFPISIDLSDADEGETTFYILKSMIDIPWGVKISGITPSTIVANIEQLTRRTLPIHPVFEGKLPLGYSIKEQKFTPEIVEISGPGTEVAEIKYIRTEPVQLSNVTASFSKTFDLEAPSEGIVFKDIKKTKLSLTISENMATRPFHNIKLSVHNCLFRCKMSPESITVVLKGPHMLLQTLKPRDIQVYIDAISKPIGTYTRKAAIKLPARTTVEKVYPIWFKLTVF